MLAVQSRVEHHPFSCWNEGTENLTLSTDSIVACKQEIQALVSGHLYHCWFVQSLVKEGMVPAEAEKRIAQLRLDCEAVIGECMEAVSGELSFFTIPNCFELFGFDLLVNPWPLTPTTTTTSCLEVCLTLLSLLASI